MFLVKIPHNGAKQRTHQNQPHIQPVGPVRTPVPWCMWRSTDCISRNVTDFDLAIAKSSTNNFVTS